MEQLQQEFDEQAALEALEQLRHQIQRAREAREQKMAEFESFVRATRAASLAERAALLDEQEGRLKGVQMAARTAERAGAPLPPAPPQRPAPSWGAVPSADLADPVAVRPRPARPHVHTRAVEAVFADERPVWSLDRRYLIGGGSGLIGLVLLIVLLWGGGSAAPDAVGTNDAAADARAATTMPESTTPGSTTASSTPARPLEIELTTLRAVWMRVIVDGARRVEREVPARETLRFGADREIVLRVGDAGGVKLIVNGVDQGSLGRDGQIAVRTLRPPAR